MVSAFAFRRRSCATCIMWTQYEETTLGLCQRFPPAVVVTAEGNGASAWPETGRDQVCGEHTASGSGQLDQFKR